MAFSGNTQNVRITLRAGSSCQTTTSFRKVACVAYTTTNYRMPYAVIDTCAAANPIIGVIDSMQSAGSEVVSIIAFGPAKVAVANTGCATFTAGQFLAYDTDTTGCVVKHATLTSLWLLGAAIGLGNTGTYADVYVNPIFRAGALVD